MYDNYIFIKHVKALKQLQISSPTSFPLTNVSWYGIQLFGFLRTSTHTIIVSYQYVSSPRGTTSKIKAPLQSKSYVIIVTLINNKDVLDNGLDTGDICLRT